MKLLITFLTMSLLMLSACGQKGPIEIEREEVFQNDRYQEIMDDDEDVKERISTDREEQSDAE